MLKILNNCRAQTTVGEYLLVFFLVTGMITAMTIFFRRTVQARIFDTRNYAFNEVAKRTTGFYDGNLYVEYEPYYTDTMSIVGRDSSMNETLLAGNTTGIYRKEIEDFTSVKTLSQTAPPKNAQ